MKKKIIIILLVLVVLSSIILVNQENKSTAQECNDCTRISTGPGNSDFKKINCNCTGAVPTIKASATTIASGGSITLWVDSGGKACPDFSWSVSSAKYTLNKSKTVNDLETVTMTAASGVCSATGYNNSNIYVTVTVTDNCGQTNQTVIRNTSGQWSAYVFYCGSGGGSNFQYGDIVGIYRYRVHLSRSCELESLTCNSCSEELASGNLGFPNSSGNYFRCSPPKPPLCEINKTNKVIAYFNGYESYVRAGFTGFYVQKSTWECP